MVMHSFRLRFALVTSIILIVGALWFRIHSSQASNSNLVAIQDDGETTPSDLISSEEFLALNATSTPTGPLSTTDLVGRQLFSDYIGLVNNGQATEENLARLASSYAETLTNTSEVRSVTSAELKTVEDTVENLQAYASVVFSTREKYKKLVIEATKGKNISDPNNSGFASLMNRLSDLYKQSGEEFLTISVPISLSATHLTLVNNYFSSAEAMKTLSKSEEDPLSAYAALDTQSKNNTEEEETLQNLQKTLMANGIMLESGT